MPFGSFGLSPILNKDKQLSKKMLVSHGTQQFLQVLQLMQLNIGCE